MYKRLNILNSFLKTSTENNFNYSATMREINKKHPNKIKEFMKNFKEAFDQGMIENSKNIEQTSLLQAIYKSNLCKDFNK